MIIRLSLVMTSAGQTFTQMEHRVQTKAFTCGLVVIDLRSGLSRKHGGIAAKRGERKMERSRSIWAKYELSTPAERCHCGFNLPGTQPNRFFTAIVRCI